MKKEFSYIGRKIGISFKLEKDKLTVSSLFFNGIGNGDIVYTDGLPYIDAQEMVTIDIGFGHLALPIRRCKFTITGNSNLFETLCQVVVNFDKE